MQVAMAVAEDIENMGDGGSRPVLLAIRGLVPTFHFEGGIVVKVHLVGGPRDEEGPEGWGVTHCEVRYYPRDGEGNYPPQKISEVWGAEKLLELKEKRWWWHPHVVR